MVSKQCNGRGSCVIHVENAVMKNIEKIKNTGYVTISYRDMGELNMLHERYIILLVGNDTEIKNQFDEKMNFRDLEEGMTIDADFSGAMTASIPPQARAYKIVVHNANKSTYTKVGRIIVADAENKFIITGKADDIYSQVRFNIAPYTVIQDRRGRNISLERLRPGQIIRVEHAAAMTFSIPPQTTAYRIQIL
jgi:hypothetical protein